MAWDKNKSLEISKFVQSTHPFTSITPNLILAGKKFSGSDWILIMEIATRLKFESGSFKFEITSELMEKLGRNYQEINNSLITLIQADIIAVTDLGNNIYQANPIFLWKGNHQTLLDKNNELMELCTFTLKEKYKSAYELTGKRILEAIQEKQLELYSQLRHSHIFKEL